MVTSARKDSTREDEGRLLVLKAFAAAGSPVDQAVAFMTHGYVPIPGFIPFHAAARRADLATGPTWVAMGGKRGPGKSHAVMAQVMDDCVRFPGLKGLFIRKIQRAAKESLQDLAHRIFSHTPHSMGADGVVLKNSSKIVLGGFKDDKDIEKYLGIEYDFIVIEECTQITEIKRDQLRGSLRSSKPGWRPRIYLDTNADGPGLQWFKRDFVLPARAAAAEGREQSGGTWFLDVTDIENPFIDVGYQQWLDGLTGPLGKAWKLGDWDAFAGMAFPEWRHSEHVIPLKDMFGIPESWMKWTSTDWGNAVPFSTHYYTKNPDNGRIYVYRELYAPGMTDRQQARLIKDSTPPTEKINLHYADPALWEKKNQNDLIFSTADEYAKEGIILTRGDNDRLGGVRKVHNALALLPDGLPGIQFFECCPAIIEQMESLAHSKTNPEDVDTDQEDHAYDDLRYALTNEKKLEQKQPPPRKNPLDLYFPAARR